MISINFFRFFIGKLLRLGDFNLEFDEENDMSRSIDIDGNIDGDGLDAQTEIEPIPISPDRYQYYEAENITTEATKQFNYDPGQQQYTQHKMYSRSEKNVNYQRIKNEREVEKLSPEPKIIKMIPVIARKFINRHKGSQKFRRNLFARAHCQFNEKKKSYN